MEHLLDLFTQNPRRMAIAGGLAFGVLLSLGKRRPFYVTVFSVALGGYGYHLHAESGGAKVSASSLRRVLHKNVNRQVLDTIQEVAGEAQEAVNDGFDSARSTFRGTVEGRVGKMQDDAKETRERLTDFETRGAAQDVD